MNTTEHTELGNALRFERWDTLKTNPYVTLNENGTLYLTLQELNEQGFPEPLKLVVSAGVIIAMSGDYFGGKEVSYKLPRIEEFRVPSLGEDSTAACEKLGKYLIHKPVTEKEELKLIKSYNRLANPNVTEKNINTIYAINNSHYIPFSSTLNFYMQQLMFSLRVKNYSEILLRNESHFTPWSVRVYAIGHHIALNYAEIFYELNQYLTHTNYQSENPTFNSIRNRIEKMSSEHIKDLAHRYQALALGMEFFCFHYYTDHFAAGHLSFMGDLRALLPKRFGMWGSILANNLHDELNRITVYTKQAYKPLPNTHETPIEAGGDSYFDKTNNKRNKQVCLAGMTASLQDLHRVFNGGKRPEQPQYGGLEFMPDIDNKTYQPKPLLLLTDKKIYFRTDLKHVPLLTPRQLQLAYSDPLNNGYAELSSKLKSFWLVLKLRALPFVYKSKLEPPAESLAFIEKDEINVTREQIIPVMNRNSNENPMRPNSSPNPVTDGILLQGLLQHGFLSNSEKSSSPFDFQETEFINSDNVCPSAV